MIKVHRVGVYARWRMTFFPLISFVIDPPAFIGTPNFCAISDVISDSRVKFNLLVSSKILSVETASPLMAIIVAFSSSRTC